MGALKQGQHHKYFPWNFRTLLCAQRTQIQLPVPIACFSAPEGQLETCQDERWPSLSVVVGSSRRKLLSQRKRGQKNTLGCRGEVKGWTFMICRFLILTLHYMLSWRTLGKSCISCLSYTRGDAERQEADMHSPSFCKEVSLKKRFCKI